MERGREASAGDGSFCAWSSSFGGCAAGGIHANQLYRWRQDLRVPVTGFAEVVVSGDLAGVPASSVPAAMIEVAFASSTQLRLPVSTPPALASAVIEALVRR